MQAVVLLQLINHHYIDILFFTVPIFSVSDSGWKQLNITHMYANHRQSMMQETETGRKCMFSMSVKIPSEHCNFIHHRNLDNQVCNYK
jgi:hypothetical protein